MNVSKYNTINRLASPFLLVSLASNILTPQISGQYLIDQNAQESRLDAHQYVLQEIDLFVSDIDIYETDNKTPHLLIGTTGIIAPKTPPIAKKQIVISKKWLFVTAYSSTPDQTDDTPFITASNTHVRDGIVAANFLRFGAKIRFPTLYDEKIYVVEDRMNSRYPYRVDIWMRSREEAKQFGAKIVPVEVIKEI